LKAAQSYSLLEGSPLTYEQKILRAFNNWLGGLRLQPNGFPARGTIAAALVVLERLQEKLDLRLEAHRAKDGQSQIEGLSRSSVARILERYGERRPFLKEGGRTNRGAPGDIGRMLRGLETADIEQVPLGDRKQILDSLQGSLVEKVREFHGKQRIKLVYDRSKPTHQLVQDLLLLASETGKAGPVAQHLVGAKLQLRYPDLAIDNRPFSAADEQVGRPGDFGIGDTAFHVTVAPMPGVYERCRENLDHGQWVYLLVPDRQLIGARQNAELVAPNRITVQSIESFVSQNLDELSEFSQKKLAQEFRLLLEAYNRRVEEAESDKSLTVEIPPNLLRET